MSQNTAVILLLVLAVIAANLPWFSERVLFVWRAPAGGKSVWLRLLEWLILYFIVGALGIGLEYRVTGSVYNQDWVFYVSTICLFVVFGLPGFIYRYDLKRHLAKRR